VTVQTGPVINVGDDSNDSSDGSMFSAASHVSSTTGLSRLPPPNGALGDDVSEIFSVVSHVTNPDAHYRPWKLNEFLRKHCHIYNGVPAAAATEEYKRLAVMLKLRSLFFIALLMSGPDTTPLYKAQGSEAQVPII
jgi:hypothetical protein